MMLFCGDSHLVNHLRNDDKEDTTWVLLILPCVQDMILRSDNQKSWMRQQQDSYVVQVETHSDSYTREGTRTAV